jgi:large subunit ribosomal protein L5
MIKSIKHYKETQLSRDLLLKKTKRNVMQTPNIDKVSINLAKKEALFSSNKLLIPLLLLKLITGQKPKITKAKKSVAQFKLRKGKALGSKVTLRNSQMYTFLDKFFYGILPQTLEVKNKKLKTNINSFSIGIEDVSIFPELENQYEFLRNTQGLNIIITLNNNKLKKNSNCLFSGLKLPL